MPQRQPPFKQAFMGVLKEHLTNQAPLIIEWTCVYCRKPHNENLLESVHAIDNSFVAENAIELMDVNGNLLGTIFISKNKKVNKTLADRYHSLGAIYIEIVHSNDQENTISDLIKPRFVGTCLNPKCKDCSAYQVEKSILIIDSFCWKCDTPMKVAVLDCNGYHGGPDRFSQEEIDLARNKGVIIENNYSKTVGSSYLSNTCPQCQILTGNHFLFDHFDAAIYGYYTYERIPLGPLLQVHLLS